MYPTAVDWNPPKRVKGETVVTISQVDYYADLILESSYWIMLEGQVVEVRQDENGRWLYTPDGIQEIYFSSLPPK